MKALSSFAFGLLFGVGLLVSGMTSPDKVIGFLDIAGNWDPSLAFVMGGAVLSAAPLFARARKACMGRNGGIPTVIDARLLAGAAIFGSGWGLAGICPGPAIVDLPLAASAVLPFLAAMFAGLMAAMALTRRR